ncbi:alkaline phosphatase D family protein [Pseudoduganella chitinolytica]|uniref:Alkaline phosphatase D family protein n=1 Tax=Pseudoduganella chitinolytica TaxID=34070 RepID=A0ABY8B8N2_9BURK|nr:alkaline phosphatase D family protein [Pseudoduganella chitinolytica]WEF32170.1 alkaline phosphatase D family protein [Pseudoduganella chitinolytica]
MTQSNSRRKFIRNFSLGTVAVSALPLAACGGDGGPNTNVQVSYAHGVASGDPLADRVILWTRITSSSKDDVEVGWSIAEDSAFTKVVASGVVTTGAAKDYTVKVDATGLASNRNYYYRFRAHEVDSPVGRTKTLPTGSVTQARFAVFSCSNYPAGYFNVYAEAAKLDDVDVALHLGDYIYEYAASGYASSDAAAMGRTSQPANEIVTLSDYRRRYQQYRSDADLQAVHARLPFITVWDDHELTNDTWRDGAENHDPATEGLFLARKQMAIQAYHEWMPTRVADASKPDRIYRSFDFGNLLSLHMLDTRVIGRDKQLAYAGYVNADKSFNTAGFTADVANPQRQLMGAEQVTWLQGQMSKSTATWQMLGQQVLMARMNLPAPMVLAGGYTTYLALAVKARNNPGSLTPAEQAQLNGPTVPYNLDAWDGYQAAREAVLNMAKSMNKNLLVLAGDTHNAWASDLADVNGNAVGVEFGVPSVSSPGFESYFPTVDPALVAAGMEQLIGPLVYAETASRGFTVVTVTPTETRAEYRYVSTIKSKTYTATTGKVLRTLPGAANRKLIAG